MWGFCISTVLLWHATFTINSLAHRFGSRRYATRDDSRNNAWLALLTLGEGWHNNHHRYPAAARQGFFWWEIDVAWYGLRLLEALGVVRDLTPVPAAIRDSHRRPATGRRDEDRRHRRRHRRERRRARGCMPRTRSRSSRRPRTSAATRTRTSVEVAGRHVSVDTGFIVYNERTYPRFTALLARLGVATQESSMSFSVRDEASGLEYNGTSLNALFAQRRNLVRPAFLGMVRDILRFNREAPRLLDGQGPDPTLGDLLAAGRYGRAFLELYIVPMGAAIWSTDPARMLDFPARFFIRFLHNHGMLTVNDRPVWRTITGGSARYVERLIAPFADRIRLATPVESVRRLPGGVLVKPRGHEAQRFDAVFLACHSDQALRLLADPDPGEREVLGAIPYRRNEAVLHTDARLLPRSALARAAWNYHRLADPAAPVALTYCMNILQRLELPFRCSSR